MGAEIGEARDAWGWDVWKKAEYFAGKILSDEPFYVVFAAKQDKNRKNTFRQGFKAYYARPPQMLGILVWYVDKAKGVFELVPQLSTPPDVPLDPSLLSKDSKDQSARISEVGQELGVVLS